MANANPLPTKRDSETNANGLDGEIPPGRIALVTKSPEILRHHFDVRHYYATSNSLIAGVSRYARTLRPPRILFAFNKSMKIGRVKTSSNHLDRRSAICHHPLAVERDMHLFMRRCSRISGRCLN
jgi:hypothetical protein